MNASFLPTRPVFALVALALGAATALHAHPAHACGGCFHAATDTSGSVVTDHRMVLSISTKQTVLWDQIRYTGNPTEFAWVLPVRQGARIELARGEMIEALDLTTQASVKGPDRACPNGGGGGSSSGGGCGGGTLTLAGTKGSFDDEGNDTGFQSDGGVEVVSQTVVGPYQAVTLRAQEGAALDRWLDANGFETPDSIVPVIAAYAREGFDFIALKLRPGFGVRSMRPVRVVTPGASPVLPLRMVTAGIGAKVGLALWIVTEGRWEAGNFPNAVIDPAKVAWVGNEQRSNYRDLAAAAVAGENGRVWLTEYSVPSASAAEGLYKTACVMLPPEKVPCGGQSNDLPWDGGLPDAAGPTDSGAPPASDAGGSADAALEPDASADAGVPTTADAGRDSGTAPACFTTRSACATFDDFDVALTGLHRSDVWVTKMRAELTPAACASSDLVLRPTAKQDRVTGSFRTDTFTDPSFDPCAGSGGSSSSGGLGPGCFCDVARAERTLPLGPIALGGLGLLVVLRIRRRR